jgi:hypothetical protein
MFSVCTFQLWYIYLTEKKSDNVQRVGRRIQQGEEDYYMYSNNQTRVSCAMIV